MLIVKENQEDRYKLTWIFRQQFARRKSRNLQYNFSKLQPFKVRSGTVYEHKLHVRV